MSRALRIEYPGAFYHVMSHGNGNQWIYKQKSDFQNFIDVLYSLKKKYQFIFHSIQLMKNHYHLVIETPLGNLSKGMLYLNREYAFLYNQQYTRKGSVFKQRYKSILIERDLYYSNVIRYTNQNCLRAGICKRVEDYPGGSFYYIFKKSKLPESKVIKSLININTINRLLGFKNISDLLLWLNGEIENAYNESKNKYKYIWGSKIWQDEIKRKYVSEKTLSHEILEKEKLEQNYSEIWKKYKELQKYKDNKQYVDILIYFLATYSSLTQKEISRKVNLNSISAVSQRLYRFRHRLKHNDKKLKEIVDSIENVKC